MAKADKKTRGRTAITETSKANPTTMKKTNPHVEQVRKANVNRGQGPGGTLHRGDRRDTHPTYTGNVKHAARGNTPRANVATRKN